jgi:hypothetical protein
MADRIQARAIRRCGELLRAITILKRLARALGVPVTALLE